MLSLNTVASHRAGASSNLPQAVQHELAPFLGALVGLKATTGGLHVRRPPVVALRIVPWGNKRCPYFTAPGKKLLETPIF